MEKNTIWPVKKFKCPHCGAISAFNCVFSAISVYTSSSLEPVSVWACHNCDGNIFARGEVTQWERVARVEFNIQEIYPSNEPNIDQNIPEGIAADYAEASRCFNVGANKASVVMSGRAIQYVRPTKVAAMKAKRQAKQADPAI